MTITEKIIQQHADIEEVRPGQLIKAKVDLVFGNDITAPLAIEEFKKINVDGVFNPDKIILIPDHFTPNKDIKSAENVKILREFARRYKVKYFEVGQCGIEHIFLPEQGFILPGDLIIGADSHTCTYGALAAFSFGVGSTDMAAAMATGWVWLRIPESIKIIYTGNLNKYVCGKDLILYTIAKLGVDGALYCALEFTGSVIKNLPMDERLTICNMAVEAGAKVGIIEADRITIGYLESIGVKDVMRKAKIYRSDEDAVYKDIIEINVEEITPQVALPHSPANCKKVEEVNNIEIDQVVIGSCTNGKLTDLRIAAYILRGRKIHPNVRLIVIPATPNIYKKALEEGLIKIFVDAGAIISPPTCGPCLGGHMGVLAEGERCVATTNRNFIGRMGHPQSEVYLTSPYIAAASSILGRISSPDEL